MSPAALPDLVAADPRAAATRRALTFALGPAGRRDPAVLAVERRRDELLADPRPMNTHLPHQEPLELPLSEIVDRVGKRGTWSRFLLGITRELDAAVGLELGSSVGLSTAYLASGCSDVVHTFEGVPGIADVARETADVLGLGERVVVHVGRFKDVLPGVVEGLAQVDLAFVDGDHEGDPTLQYLETLRPVLGPTSLVVFDDIRWSPGMKRAWRTIRHRDDTGVAIDLGRIGVWGPAG